jgi:hypothetical protein
MLTPPELLQHCEAEQKDMERNVFAFPPSDWAAFQNRLGNWQGVEKMRAFLERVIEDEKRLDDDK